MWCFNPASITGCPCGSYSHNPQLMRRLLPYHQNHETNPSGLQPQATNGKILEGLSWNRKKGSLGMSLGEEITSLTSPRGVISPGGCIQATLTNTSCPSRLRGGKAWLYELCVRRCEGGRHVKKCPGRRNQREETASQGSQSPADGTVQTREAKFASRYLLRGEGPLPCVGHCGFSVSPISQVNQWLR